ncbi:MAG: hypothetical protein A3G93_09430 [Nitrospinae bacterium RIFCSPLOWO2_12_FULL_45_22]|nr:MAG: hypothetical protein A3G93_09430 [Nitrospinae bacterium RIFCSPLOWO2_12_FULL_45_22]
MRQIAIYGKGGIGKSTITSNLSIALAQRKYKVIQIGCDPKRDSTRMLLYGQLKPTVLDTLRQVGEVGLTLQMIMHEGIYGIKCIECGGPEPGVGCAGRGIITTFKLLEQMDAFKNQPDFILYDVLGDVVCGGFALPIREGYAQEIYLVASGEFMSLYAANNICQGLVKFARRGEGRLAGIIGNSRRVRNEELLLKTFAQRIGTTLVEFIPWDDKVREAEIYRKPVLDYDPQGTFSHAMQQLTDRILTNKDLVIPKPLSLEELESMIQEGEIRHGTF